jgi:hypothetical protein
LQCNVIVELSRLLKLHCPFYSGLYMTEKNMWLMVC